MASNRYKKLAKDTMIFAIGNVLTKVVYFLMVPLYTLSLTTSQYGIAEMLNTLIEIAYPIFTVSIVDALYRFTIDDNADYQQVYSISLKLILQSCFIMTVICIPIGLFTKDSRYFLFLFLYISYCFYKVGIQFARGLGHNLSFSIAGVINALVLCISNVILLLGFDGGVNSYISSIIIANIISGIYIFLVTRQYRYISFREKEDKKLKRQMLIYSLPNIPNMLSWWIVNVSDRYLMQWMVSNAACGTYTAASKLPSLISTFSMIFQQAWQYTATKQNKSEDKNEFYSDIFKFYSTFLVCFCSLIILGSDLLSKIILQKEFYEGRFVLPILIVAAVYGCYSGYFGTIYGVVKKNKMAMISTIVAASVNIILNIALIPFIGATGAAYSTLICYIVITLIRYFDTRKYMTLLVNKGKILLENILIITQAVIMTIDNNVKYIFVLAITFIIFAINIKDIINIVKKMISAVKIKFYKQKEN